MNNNLARSRTSLTRRLIYAAAVIAVIALAWALRIRAVKMLPIDYDEDDYMRAGQQYAEGLQAGDWAVFTRENYRPEHPPLAKIVYGFVMSPLPPTREILDRPSNTPPVDILPIKHLRASRTASAVFGTLAVGLLALINPIGGLFLAVHTMSVKYTSQVMIESLPLLTSALCIVAYERSRVFDQPRLNAWLILSGIALGLTAASKYMYCVVGIAILAHWAWSWWNSGRSLPALREITPLVLGWGALSLIAFFAADPYLWPDPITRLPESVLFHGDYAQSEDVEKVGYPTWQPFIWLLTSASEWHPDVFLITLDLLIIGLALLGLARLATRRPIYLFWIVAALGFLLIWPTKWPQYIMILMFPISLAAGEGILTLWTPLARWAKRLSRPSHTDRTTQSTQSSPD